MTQGHPPRILFAGNPNCGKTSLFNALTGSRQKVGNYPGVTVERRSARMILGTDDLEIVDLPGTYSLFAYSPEERVATEEILASPDDVVVVVADATNLHRSLVLLVQLFLIPRRMVLCLNMVDEAERAGQLLDRVLLEKLLGLPVVTTVAHRGEGTEALCATIQHVLREPVPAVHPIRSSALRSAIDTVAAELGDAYPAFSARFLALSLLMVPETLGERLAALGNRGAGALRVAEEQRSLIESSSQQDISLFVTNYHFGFVHGVLQRVVLQHPRENAREFSNRIDRILVHPWLGGPIFLMILYALFYVTFRVGAYPMGWLEQGVQALGRWVGGAWPPDSTSPLRSLLVDGVLGGVGGVVVFLPNILLLFLGLSFLEDTGYMARAAFIMDRVMHRFGLHGRSFVPMVTGLGCTVPGMMATRTIESERDRLATLFVLPLMSCGARLPIWMLLIPAFFSPALQAPALFAIYLFGIGLALVLALLLRRTWLRGEDAPFVMELPPYRLPTWRSAFVMSAERASVYLRKAGSTILAISIVMWAITAYPKAPLAPTPKAHVDPRSQGTTALDASFAGQLGHLMEPALRPLGLDWKVGIGLVGAFAAKEVFVAQMGVVYALAEDNPSEQERSLSRKIAGDYSPAAGLALMVFLLVATPCMATVVVMRREAGSWKWAAAQFLGLTVLGYALAFVTYQVASLFL